MLNSSGISTHSCLNPYVTSNQSESSPSSMRTRACMPPWNWRITAIISSGHRLGPAFSTAALGRPNRRPSRGQQSTCTAVFSAVAPVLEVDALRTACRRWIVPVGIRTVRLVECHGLHSSYRGGWLRSSEALCLRAREVRSPCSHCSWIGPTSSRSLW